MSEEPTAPRTWRQAPRHPSKWWQVFFTGIWLLYLGQPVADLMTGAHPVWERLVGLAVTASFAAIYLLGLMYGLRQIRACQDGVSSMLFKIGVPSVLLAISFAMVPLVGIDSGTYLIFAMVSVIMAWPVVVTVPMSVVSIAWLGLFLPMTIGHDPAPILAFIGLVISAFMFGIRRIQAQEAVIKRAQEDMAQLAVDAERARFSRDLHDIVGHSLTAIIVKAELARRLAERQPETVGPEVQAIEGLARETLEDVRRTVAGYREVTLSGELASARSVLDAAGISTTLPQAVDEIPGEMRELFGWVVREGVTNVVRHSGARLCRIRVTPASVEVLDDGRGGKLPPGGGFTGLRERVQAKGGTFEAGPASAGGFRLYVAVPATKPAPSAPTARRAGVQREGARA